MNNTVNPYLVLNAKESDDDTQIRKAYQEQLKKFPPEQNPERFQEISQAYELIRDEISRARLRVFGRNLNEHTKFQDLVPECDGERLRIPFNDWITDIKSTQAGQQK